MAKNLRQSYVTGEQIGQAKQMDLLSFATLRKDKWKNYDYLLLSGIYQPGRALSETPLPAALAQHLHDRPGTRRIVLCLDNDDAGRLADMRSAAGQGQGLQPAASD